jgi:putative addiction module component (TIGR02574 family)
MSLAELKREALLLSEEERAELINELLDSFPHYERPADEEVLRRIEEFDSGKEKALSHEEFWQRVAADRRNKTV